MFMNRRVNIQRERGACEVVGKKFELSAFFQGGRGN